VTAPTAPTEAVAAAALAAAAQLGRSLGIEADAVPAAGPELVPGPGSVAVSATLRGGATGRVCLLLGSELAQALTNGPLGPVNLVASTETLLTAAAAAASTALGAPVQVQAPQEIAVEAALAGAQAPVGARLVAGGQAIAAIALHVDPIVAAVPQQGGPAPANFGPLPATGPRAAVPSARLELLNDVEMAVTVELGRTRMTVRDLLSLAPGVVVELDRAAGSPVDLYVNGRLIARGEVVVVDEEFGVRITEIVGSDVVGR
jgi:flagellar motor switch protein FliN/FliY